MNLYIFIIVSITFFSLFTPSISQNTTDVILLLRAPLPKSYDQIEGGEYFNDSVNSINGTCYACGDKISILAFVETTDSYNNTGSPDLPNLISITLTWPSFLKYDSIQSLCSETIIDNYCKNSGTANVTTVDYYSSDTNFMTLKISKIDASSALVIRMNFTIVCQDNFSSMGESDSIGITYTQDNHQQESMITFSNIQDILNCDDGDSCTLDQVLSPSGPNFCSKTCGDHIPITCNDNTRCTIGLCVNPSGCIYIPISCDDDDNCTTDECRYGYGCVNNKVDEECYDPKTHPYHEREDAKFKWPGYELILGLILECLVCLGLGLIVGYKTTKPKNYINY